MLVEDVFDAGSACDPREGSKVPRVIPPVGAPFRNLASTSTQPGFPEGHLGGAPRALGGRPAALLGDAHGALPGGRPAAQLGGAHCALLGGRQAGEVGGWVYCGPVRPEPTALHLDCLGVSPYSRMVRKTIPINTMFFTHSSVASQQATLPLGPLRIQTG
jgi:hypothetical protein